MVGRRHHLTRPLHQNAVRPGPGSYAPICLLHCLDDTREFPPHVEGVAYGGFAVDRVGVSCMGFHVHNRNYTCLI